MKLTNKHYISIVTALILIGCGSTGNNNPSTTINSTETPTNSDKNIDSTITKNQSNSTSDTQVTNNSTGVSQCKKIQSSLDEINNKYANSKDEYIAYATTSPIFIGKGSDDGGSKGSNDNKGSGDGGSKGSSDNDTKGSGGNGGSHNEGKNCLACHSFASAGTVFTSLHAGNNTPGAAGYRIKLSTGLVFNGARGTGNSRSSSFPSGKFTAQVMDPNGNIVNSSAENSHDGSRRACNSCHSASGNSGAPGRITSKHLTSSSIPIAPVSPITTTTDCSAVVSFNKNILPVLTAKCKSCHGSNGRFKVTSANGTYANISSLKGSSTAGTSYLLDKATNTVGHGGGTVISNTSAEYTTIKAWLDAGAPNN